MILSKGFLTKMCTPLGDLWIFFPTLKIKKNKNPENLVENYHDDVFKNDQKHSPTFRYFFMVNLVLD